MVDADADGEGPRTGHELRQDPTRTSTSSWKPQAPSSSERLSYDDAAGGVLPAPRSRRTGGDRTQIHSFDDVHLGLTSRFPLVTVVMTLLVRDERDIVEEQLAFHLAAGVDHVIVDRPRLERRHARRCSRASSATAG